MNPNLEKSIVHYATMVLEWLDIDAKEDQVARPALVELFIDTLNALEQIKEREYFRRYMNSGKKIMLIGVNFDSEAAQIASWKYETV